MMTKCFLLSGFPVVFAWSITPADASTLASAVSILLAAIFVGVVNIITARSAARAAVAPVAAKIEEIVPIVKRVDTHVNSEKSRSEGEIATLKMQVELQRETITDLKMAKELLAAAKAQTDMITAVSQAAVAGAATPAVVHPPVASAPVLASIDQNTKDTARNTAKTDEAVQTLKDQGAGTP